jgi:hypothetical protein
VKVFVDRFVSGEDGARPIEIADHERDHAPLGERTRKPFEFAFAKERTGRTVQNEHTGKAAWRPRREGFDGDLPSAALEALAKGVHRETSRSSRGGKRTE